MSFYFSWISPFAPGDPMCFQDGRGQSTVALRDFESGEAIDILGHHFKVKYRWMEKDRHLETT